MTEERDTLLKSQTESIRNIQRSDNVFLRAARKGSSKAESALTKELQSVAQELDQLKAAMQTWNDVSASCVANIAVRVEAVTDACASLLHSRAPPS